MVRLDQVRFGFLGTFSCKLREIDEKVPNFFAVGLKFFELTHPTHLVLVESQYPLFPQLPQKIMLASKVVKSDSKNHLIS